MARRTREIVHQRAKEVRIGAGPSEVAGCVELQHRWQTVIDGERTRVHIRGDVSHQDAINIAACIVKAVPDGRAMLDRTLAEIDAADEDELDRGINPGEDPPEPKGA